MKTVGIYGIHNCITGKWYVGSSVNIERRWVTHRRELDRGTHTGVKLLRAFQAHTDPSVWEWVILEEVSKEHLLTREAWWIRELRAYCDGYNSLEHPGHSRLGVKQSQETIAKRVATRRANGSYRHTESTRKKLGDIQRGVPKGPMSEEQKAKISEARLAGVSEAFREKMGDLARGREYTPEMRKNMSEAHLGYVMPASQKDKIASALKGKPKNPDSIRKMLLKRRETSGQTISKETCDKYGIPYE